MIDSFVKLAAEAPAGVNAILRAKRAWEGKEPTHEIHSTGITRRNYLVVASNIAWLRAGENGQTMVGIVGGQPLQVTGSIEEVAATILAD